MRSGILYHMAAAVGVRLILEKPLDAMRTNIQGPVKVLELCDQPSRMCDRPLGLLNQ